MPRVARHHRFEMRRRSPRAQPVVQNAGNDGRRESRNRNHTNQKYRSAFHGAENYPAY
jgi:hypothetical protein